MSRQYHQTMERDPAEDQARHQEQPGAEQARRRAAAIRPEARSAGGCDGSATVTRRGDDGIGDHGRFIAETSGRTGLRRARRRPTAWR